MAITVALSVYSQLVAKWRVMGRRGSIPRLLLDPWVMSGFAAAALAGLAWFAALTTLEVSHAYPFLAGSFVIVMLASAPLFGERLTAFKVAGTLMIVAGLAIGSAA